MIDEKKKQKFVERYNRLKENDCILCDDLVKERKQIVIYRGNPGSNVAIIGMNPGRNENIQGMPFVGKAGNLIDDIIYEAGYEPDDFMFTNVVMCYIKDNTKLNDDHFHRCKTNLKAIVDHIDVYVTLGKYAFDGITSLYNPHLYYEMKKKSMGAVCTAGEPYRLNHGKSLFVSLHPAYLLRQGWKSKRYPKFMTVAREIKAAKKW